MPRGGTLSSLGTSFEELIRGANESREAVADLGNQLSSVSQATQRNAQQISAVIETLREGMTGIRTEIQNLAQGFTNLSSSTTQGRRAIQQETASVDDLWAAYRKMGIEIKALTVNLDTLQFSQKEINKVVQLGTEYNTERIDSYTALSQKYRALKILIDQMTVSERENTEQGRALVAQAREMYEQMNILQQQTGKYQLQVGNYSKAMTGLNIATNQVVRELPVLANGVSMFAIAISNNIPILLDNVMAVKRANEALAAHKKELLENAAAAKAMGDTSKAMALETEANAIKTMSVAKGLAASLFSWQTAVVLVLTVLPGLIRNIQNKKKAQEEANKSTKEAITLENLLAEAYKESDKEQERSISRLQTLYYITQDNLRSQDDRIKAAQILKKEYEEEFGLLSEQEILLGNAKAAYDQLTSSLMEQAKARAYLNKITALQEQTIDLKILRDKAKPEKDAADAEVARYQAIVDSLKETEQASSFNKEYNESLTALQKAQERQTKAMQEYVRADAPLQELDNAILKLMQDIPVGGLMGEILGGHNGGGSKAFKIADYYNEALQALIEGMEDGLQKQLALLDLGWKKQQETYENYRQELLRIQREGNAEERKEATTQLTNLNFALISLEQNYINERKRLIKEMVDSYKTIVKDEGDVEKIERERLATRLKADQKLREMAAYEDFEISKRSAEDKERLNQALADSEKKYWEDYLSTLREAGLLTVEEYNNIMSNLAKAVRNGESAMSRGRRGKKYGGILEAILAQTSTFGEGNKFGQGILKEEYVNFVTAMDSALKTSMQYMDEWMAKRMEMAQVAVEAAQKEVEATKKYLDYELETRANGFANRVDTARKEVELARETHKKALAEQKRLQDQQLALDAISQTSSLITATANIWEAMTKGTGVAGPILAAAATAALWASFAASKIKARQLAGLKAEQYGEGTVELLQGGSHASGHDIDLGTKRDGTRRRAEGGEFFAVINKRNSKRFRSVIPDVINSFNDGTFGERYQSVNAAMGDYAINLLGGAKTDISSLERDVNAIRNQGNEARFVDSQGNMVVKYKNLTRKIKN